jgi:cation diffusion facilitator family transporter
MNTAWAQRLTPQRLLWASVVVALVTMGLKTLAWWLTGSVGLLSDAMESVVNLAGAMFGLWMVTIAARPADADHPYGHHKAEYFSTGFEGLLIIAAALGIAWAALARWLQPQPLQALDLGLGLTVSASVLNGTLAWLMLAAARRHRSVALEGDAKHLLTDVWTSVGVVLGLSMVFVTGWSWLDPVVAMVVAVNVFKEGLRLVWRASQGLMDVAMPPDEQRALQEALRAWTSQHPDTTVEAVVTRQAGQQRFAQWRLVVPGDWSMATADAHRTDMELRIGQAFPHITLGVQLVCAQDPLMNGGGLHSPSAT